MTSCTAAPVAKFNRNITTPTSNAVFLNVINDPDLIMLDLQEKLNSFGLKVDLAEGEASHSQIIVNKNVITEYKKVSVSKAPYELLVTYSRGGYPYRINWRSILRDRINNKVIATYKYDFNAATESFGWDNDKIMDDMISNIIKPFWKAPQHN